MPLVDITHIRHTIDIFMSAPTIVQVCCSTTSSLLLDNKGKVYLQMLPGGDIKEIRIDGHALQVSCGPSHFCVVMDKSPPNLLVWGDNSRGQLGTGDRKSLTIPTLVTAIHDDAITSVSCGIDFTIAITSNGLTYYWGHMDGRLIGALGESEDILTPSIRQNRGMEAGSIYRKNLRPVASLSKPDSILESLEKSLSLLEVKLLDLKESYHSLQKSLEKQTATISISQLEHNKLKKKIAGFWKSVETYQAELKKQRESERAEELEQYQVKYNDAKYFAIAGDASIKDQATKLVALEKDRDKTQVLIRDTSKDIENIESLINILQFFKNQQVDTLLGEQAIKNFTVISSVLDQVTSALRQMKRASVENLAKNDAKAHQMDISTSKDQRCDIRQLLQCSDETVDNLLTSIKSSMSEIVHTETDSDKADYTYIATSFEAFCNEALTEIVELRKEVNMYISHLLGLTNQQVEEIHRENRGQAKP